MASNTFIPGMFVTIHPLMETFAVQRDQKALQVLLRATDFVTGNSSLPCDRLLKVIPRPVSWVLWFVWGCSRAQVAPTAPQNLPGASWTRVHQHHMQYSYALGSWKMRPLHCNIINSCTSHCTGCWQSHLQINNLFTGRCTSMKKILMAIPIHLFGFWSYALYWISLAQSDSKHSRNHNEDQAVMPT